MAFCPFNPNNSKKDGFSPCIISCALYDNLTKECSIKVIANNTKKPDKTPKVKINQ